jgi:DNA repair exonuclease SbcCD nuclease subunit
LQALVGLAVEAEVDLVLIAGDLFEHNRVRDSLVSFVVEQLRGLPRPVIVLPGNHDCLVPDSVYYREHLWAEALNIHVIKALAGETLTWPDLGVAVWGKPLDAYGGDLRPLAGVPPRGLEAQWHIAMAHGCYVGSAHHPYYSFQIRQEEIEASQRDYVALGHWATFNCVCDGPVKAYYCGSPSLLGTAAIVDLREGIGVQVTRCCLPK